MRILVTGATGNIGRKVVDYLQGSGVTIRALTANPQKAPLPSSVEVCEGYIGRPESVVPALEGVDKMYLAPVPETAREVMEIAKAAGIWHVIDLSGEHESWWGDVTIAVEQSGVCWTHLWPSEFMENSFYWVDQIRQTRQVRDIYPTSRHAPIAMQDVAAVAARCLLDDGHEGQAYLLLGPESISRIEQVRAIGDAIGHQVPFVEVSYDEAYRELSKSFGDFAGWYLDWKRDLTVEPQTGLPIVEEITKRPATTFAEWARINADAFR